MTFLRHLRSSPSPLLSNKRRYIVSSSEDKDETIIKTPSKDNAANIIAIATALNTSISSSKIPIVLVPRMQRKQPSRLLSEKELSSSSSSSSPSPSSPSPPSPSPRCPLIDDVPFLEPDFPTNYSMALLDSMPLSIDDPRPFQLENIDLLMMATTSIEPFHCRMYALFYTRPQRVLRCKYTKLTAYLEKRHDLFDPLRSPSLSARPNKAKCNRIWYEFYVGAIENCTFCFN